MKYKILALMFGTPSIIIGAFIMQQNQVPKVIWMQNIIAYLIFGGVSLLAVNKTHAFLKGKSVLILIGMTLLLSLTFVNDGMEGVHRWLQIVGVRLNIAMILLPAMLILLWELLQEVRKNNRNPAILAVLLSLVVIFMLLCQPDASLLTGFAIPATIIIFTNIKNKWSKYFIAIVFISAIILVWTNLDHLPPVEYVEQIINMLERKGNLWLIAGVLSLILQLLPFFIVTAKNVSFISKCVGVYFLIIIISTWFGNFPVPLMGYGISPIMGYIISITMLANRKK